MQPVAPESGTVYQFELFFELSPDLLCIAGFDGFFKRINPAVSKLLGYTTEELLSKPINEFVHDHDKEATHLVRTQLTKSNSLLNFENRYITKQGEIVWLSWTSMYVMNERLIFAIAKDISHKKKLEEERNSLLINLTKINKDLKHLTYTTSHDLRAPVNNLLTIFGFLDVTKITDPETLEIIGVLKLASENLKKTLNEYVDELARKDHLHADIEEVDFGESLGKVLGSIESLLKHSNASIQVNFSELEKISFNRAYLESIFLNLITNSIKYARPDHAPRIRVDSRNDKGIKQLVIADNGMGFDMDKVKDRIFGLHQKFHDHVDSKGIGLYLVYSHVTTLGGHIVVESKINEGAKFIISFSDDA